MASKIVLNNSSIKVYDYRPGDCEELEKSLSVWNSNYYRWEPKGLSYDEDNNILTLPRGIDVDYIKSKLKCPVVTNKEYNEYEKTKFKLKIEPRDDIQKKAISFLVGTDKFKKSFGYSQLSLNLDTGDGKTYCVIASLCLLHCKAIIISHTENIKEQWYSSIQKFTNIDKRRILNISGTKVLEKFDDSSDYDIYLVNHRTIHEYAKKHGWDSLNDLFKEMKIGIKVFDEAHIEFSSILNIDFNTNVFKTFYLTATFERTDRGEDRVFKLCFKNIAKYGYETRGEKRKHIKYIAVLYNSKPDIEARMSIRGPKGFDRYAYMDYQLSNGMLFEVIQYVMEKFEKIDGKCLILSSKIESSEVIADKVKEWYKDKDIKTYHSKMSKKEKENYKEADIISTTPQSCGTGFDLPGLRYNIMCEPYNAHITAEQVCGRLREIPDKYTFHIELIDVGFPKVKEMYKKRLSVFKKKCYGVYELNY